MQKIIIILAMFALIAGCSSCITNTEATDLTHMGQPASNHVVLEAVGVANGCEPSGLEFFRVLTDGTREGTAFRVSDGMVLVVTDVDWQYSYQNVPSLRNVQTLRLFVENLTDKEIRKRVFESTAYLVDDGQGNLSGGMSESMTSGFIVSSEARICVDISPGPTGPSGGGLQHLILRGYLTDDK